MQTTITIKEDRDNVTSVQGGTLEHNISGFDKSIGNGETVVILKSIDQINTYYANFNTSSLISESK